MQTNPQPLLTFEQLATAYTSRLLSDAAFQTLLSLVRDLPPWLSSRTESKNPQTGASLSTSKPSTTDGPVW